MFRSVTSLTLLLLCLTQAATEATPVIFKFSGIVRSVSDPQNELGGTVIPGTTVFTGSYTFDSATPADSGTDKAMYRDTLQSFNIKVGTHEFDIVSNYRNWIQLLDDPTFNHYYGVVKGTTFGGPDGLYTEIGLTDTSQTALSSLDLPLAPPDLSAFGSNFIDLRRTINDSIQLRVNGDVTSLTSIPEPTAFIYCLLMGVTLFGIVWQKRCNSGCAAGGAEPH